MQSPAPTTEIDPPPSPAPVNKKRQRSGVTRRSVILGMALVPPNCYWVLRMEEVMYGPFPSLISLFANVVFLLFLLMGANALARRVAPAFAFSQGELLVLYSILAISTGMAGQSGLNIVCGMIAHAAWFGSSGNGWREDLAFFPKGMVLRDKEIVRGHYLGASSFYSPEVLRAWATPILLWTLLVSLLLWVAYCVNILVRQQWAEHERLTFPITWLPLEMTEGGTGERFFRNRLMWSGFALAGGINLWNGLAFLYPSLPALPIGIIDLRPLFTQKPWNALDWTPCTLYPVAIGLCYLLPLDLLFSCWFFYLTWKAQRILTSAFAWDAVPDAPFISEQGAGAVMALFCYYLWSGRRHFGAVWRRAWSAKQETSEALSERAALLGAAGGCLGLFLCCLAMQVTWWAALLFFPFYIPMLIVVTRIRAELGAPVHDFTFMGPDFMAPRVLSAGVFQKTDLAFLSLSYPLTYSRSNDTMPIALETMQMGRRTGMPARRLFGVLLAATLWATISTFWAYEHQAYQMGAAAKFNAGTHFAYESLDRLSSWLGGTRDARPNLTATIAMGAGFWATLGLMAMRLRFFGFPLHPIGYALSSAWAINIVWVPMIIAWVLKGLTLRYGGLRAYRLFTPFFLGLALGDCVMGSFWGALSMALHMRTYNFFGI